MHSWFAEFVAGTWFFVVGACVGSFLNVVVYRLPRGITLLGSSCCPFCKRPIPPRDNLPILGWLALRGRCRHCHLRIAARYPLVELLMATVFFSLAVADIAWTGQTHPDQPVARLTGFAWHLFEPHWPLILLFALHAMLLSLLVCVWLIILDGQPVPAALLAVFPLLAAGSYLGPYGMAFWLADARIGFLEISWWPAPAQLLPGAAVGLLAAGIVGGRGGARAESQRGVRATGAAGAIWAWAGTGALLGSSGAGSALVLAAALTLAQRGWRHIRRGRSSYDRAGASHWGVAAGVLFFATWLHLLAWCWLARIPAWPAPARPVFQAWPWLVAVAAAAWALRQWPAAAGAGAGALQEARPQPCPDASDAAADDGAAAGR